MERTVIKNLKKILPPRLKGFLSNEMRRTLREESMAKSMAFTEKFNYSPQDMTYSRKLVNCPINSGLTRIAWLIPGFSHPYGGLFTIFRFGDYLKGRGYQSKFIIYNDPRYMVGSNFQVISRYFPRIDIEDFVTLRGSIEEIPESDVAMATLWNSSYPLLKIRNTKRKIYFIQDFEPLFHPAGTIYGLIENTYRFPFHRIVNTKGLYDYVNNNYKVDGVKSTYFTPGIDDTFRYTEKPIDKRVRIFFYARPDTSRNAFELGISLLKKIKKTYKNKVEIVCAGESFEFKEWGLESVSDSMVNLGTLNYEDLPSFYSSFHIGICFMFTKHHSYIPLELMKSGCLVFTNHNEANLWLYKDGYNCVLAYPSIDMMMERFDAIINAPSTYLGIIRNAHKTVKEFTWDSAFNTILRFINQL